MKVCGKGMFMDHVFVNKFNWQLNNKTIKNNSLRPFVL